MCERNLNHGLTRILIDRYRQNLIQIEIKGINQHLHTIV